MCVYVYNLVSFPGPFIFQVGLGTRLQATVIKILSFPVPNNIRKRFGNELSHVQKIGHSGASG